jgi:hypothetical protein
MNTVKFFNCQFVECAFPLGFKFKQSNFIFSSLDEEKTKEVTLKGGTGIKPKIYKTTLGSAPGIDDSMVEKSSPEVSVTLRRVPLREGMASSLERLRNPSSSNLSSPKTR